MNQIFKPMKKPPNNETKFDHIDKQTPNKKRRHQIWYIFVYSYKVNLKKKQHHNSQIQKPRIEYPMWNKIQLMDKIVPR